MHPADALTPSRDWRNEEMESLGTWQGGNLYQASSFIYLKLIPAGQHMTGSMQSM
jgi:hypothetical protein